MAERLGFPRPDPTLIATAISEVARNIVVHAGRGEIVLTPFEDADRFGLVVTARRRGRGHPRRRGGAARRLQRPRRPGLGLPGARRLMDDFQLESDADSGTTVTMRSGATATSSRGGARSTGDVAERTVREPVEWGVATRCRRGETDERRPRASSRVLPEGALVAGIDGLGHGTEAAHAAAAGRGGRARDGRAQDLVRWSQRCHDALRGTRGAAISLAFVSAAEARLDLARGRQRGGPRAERRPARPTRPKGSLALGAACRATSCPPCGPPTLDVAPGDVLVLATDGIDAALRRRARRLRLDARRSAIASWPSPGSRRTTRSWSPSATSGRAGDRAGGPGRREPFGASLRDRARAPTCATDRRPRCRSPTSSGAKPWAGS